VVGLLPKGENKKGRTRIGSDGRGRFGKKALRRVKNKTARAGEIGEN